MDSQINQNLDRDFNNDRGKRSSCSRWLIVGILILALLAVCVGIAAVAYFTISPVRVGGLQIGGDVLKTSATAEEQGSFTVSGPAFLSVDTQFGNVEVTGGDGTEIQVRARKTAWGANTEAAERELNDLKVVMEQDGNTLMVRVEQPPSNGLLDQSRSGSVDFTIAAPRQTTVSAETNSGSIDLTGLEGKADLNTSFGSVTVTDFKGGLAVHAGSGEITARRIGTLESGNGDITLKSDFGNVTLEDAATERVELQSGSGAVSLTNVKSSGPLTLETDFGNIDYKTGQMSELTANTRSGNLAFSDLLVRGLVTAHSDFGPLSLVKVTAASYDLSSDSGQVTVDGVQGNVKVQTGFGDVEIGDGEEAVLDLETQSGKIVYRGSLGKGDHLLKTDFGSVELSLPADSAFHFDLQTGFGKISSDFQIQIDGDPNEKHWIGTVGAGGANLVIETQNGDISLGKTD